MRRLAPRVNVIPVIGKADSLTPSELHDFKRRVMEDIEYYSIPVYNFPYDAEEDDEDTIQENSELRVCCALPTRWYFADQSRRAGPHALRHRRIRGGSRGQRPARPREAVSVGHRRGRQPSAQRLPAPSYGSPPDSPPRRQGDHGAAGLFSLTQGFEALTLSSLSPPLLIRHLSIDRSSRMTARCVTPCCIVKRKRR